MVSALVVQSVQLPSDMKVVGLNLTTEVIFKSKRQNCRDK